VQIISLTSVPGVDGEGKTDGFSRAFTVPNGRKSRSKRSPHPKILLLPDILAP
jgi:hypothetical protein